jgi:uncharacterized protein (DUF433 family)
MIGKPCVAGTRIPVECILQELAGGMSIQDITNAHPRLTDDDVYAAIDFAAEVVRHNLLETLTPQ